MVGSGYSKRLMGEEEQGARDGLHPKGDALTRGANYSFYMVAICGVEVVVGKLRNMRLFLGLLRALLSSGASGELVVR